MTKRIFATLLAVSLLLVYPVSAFADEAGVEDDTSPITSSFIKEATLSVAPLNEGGSEISLSKTEPLSTKTRGINDEQVYRSSTLTFIAESASEEEEILSEIDLARRGGGTIYDDDTFFGSSCYIYISITYTTRSSSIGTEARINSVTTKYSTNSGTYVSSAQLCINCVGTSASSGTVNKDADITVTKSPYTTTLPNSWPYVYTGSPVLGAKFTVTAARPAGTSATHTVSATVFVN